MPEFSPMVATGDILVFEAADVSFGAVDVSFGTVDAVF
jgi:hypothetical protein